jgi:hypothetical protein
MVYERSENWAPGVAGGTLIRAVDLNHIEDGITTVSRDVETALAGIDDLNTNLTDLSGQVAVIQTGLANGTYGGGTGGGSTGGNGTVGTGTVTKADVGLGSVDNTADAAKPISTAQQAALDLKAPINSPTFTGTVAGITKTMVGLGNVDNTADTAKPVSTPQQTALNLKANLASPTFTGTVSGITKTMVGLGNVDNTSDAAKFGAYGVNPVIKYTGTAWPSRTVPSGYSGPVIWDSQIYSGVGSPVGMLDNDLWARKRAA